MPRQGPGMSGGTGKRPRRPKPPPRPPVTATTPADSGREKVGGTRERAQQRAQRRRLYVAPTTVEERRPQPGQRRVVRVSQEHYGGRHRAPPTIETGVRDMQARQNQYAQAALEDYYRRLMSDRTFTGKLEAATLETDRRELGDVFFKHLQDARWNLYRHYWQSKVPRAERASHEANLPHLGRGGATELSQDEIADVYLSAALTPETLRQVKEQSPAAAARRVEEFAIPPVVSRALGMSHLAGSITPPSEEGPHHFAWWEYPLGFAAVLPFGKGASFARMATGKAAVSAGVKAGRAEASRAFANRRIQRASKWVVEDVEGRHVVWQRDKRTGANLRSGPAFMSTNKEAAEGYAAKMRARDLRREKPPESEGEIAARTAQIAHYEEHGYPRHVLQAIQKGVPEHEALAAQRLADLSATVRRVPDGKLTLDAELNPHVGGGYGVSVHPDRELMIPAERVSPSTLLKYRDKNNGLLATDPKLMVGAWHDPETGYVHFDLSRVLPSKAAAMQVARAKGGRAIFDFQTGESIPVEGAGITGGAPSRRITRRERESTYHGMRAQFPRSPSTPTAYGQELIDRASERIGMTVDELRLSQSRFKRGLGRGLTPISARARVPKMRGKTEQRLGQRRARARMAVEKRTVHAPGHFMGVPLNEGSQMAHAVWVQLPQAYRNVEGLKAWRDGFLVRELEDLADVSETGFKARVEQHIAEAQVEMQAAFKSGDVAEARRIQGDIAQLDMTRADVKNRIADIQDEIKKFDKLIEKPPEYNPAVAEAAQALNREAEEIITRYFPEEAAKFGPRTEKPARFLGLEPDGSEVYLHHSMTKGKAAISPGAGLGRVKPPAGVNQRLGLVLARTGRVRLSMDAAVEHWQEAQSYEFAALARNDLASMGSPLKERPGMRPGPDDLVVNPEGKPKPRAWQRDPEMIAAEEGFDPAEFHVRNLREVMEATIAEGPAREQFIREAMEAGQLDALRVVPRDVFKRYVGQYRDTKLTLATPGLMDEANKLVKATDAVNSMLYLSLIYANPGYIPANVVANFIMHFLQAGVFVPRDFARTVQLLQGSSKLRGEKYQRIVDMMRAEVGHGPTVEAAAATRVLQKPIHWVAMIPDDPVRMSAFLHEAARLNVISGKWNPLKVYLSEKDIAALEKLLKDPAMTSRLNDVQDRAVQAMVDFERLGPMERAVVKRMMFVWSWTRGAIRYPFRFTLDHPGRVGAMAYLLAGAPGAPQEFRDKLNEYMPTLAKGMPPWLQGAINAGTTEVGGKTYPRVLPTWQISPVGVPISAYQTLTEKPGAQKLTEWVNPLLPAGYHVGAGESPYGREEGYWQALRDAGERLAPTLKLGTDLYRGEGSDLYPEDVTRVGRLKRALRVFPIAIDPEEAQKARVREGMTSTKENTLRNFKSDSKQYLNQDPPAEAVEQAKWKIDLDHEIRDKAEDDDRHVVYGKALPILADYLGRYRGFHPDLSSVRTEGEAHVAYNYLRRYLYPDYNAWDNKIEKAREAAEGKKPIGGK